MRARSEEIPPHVLAAIHREYPENDFSIKPRGSHRGHVTDLVPRLLEDLKSQCGARVIRDYVDGNYDACYWIELGGEDSKVKTRAQLSFLGPFAAVTDFVFEPGGWVFQGQQSRSDLRDCAIDVLRRHALETLPWDVLELRVENMRGRPLGKDPRPPSVYHCLFSEI